MNETLPPHWSKSDFRAGAWAFVVFFALALVSGATGALLAEGVLGIHYRWGLFLGIGISAAIHRERSDPRPATASGGDGRAKR